MNGSIIGAGLAGLIVAHAFPGWPIYEAAPRPRESHRAVLRFRTDAVARLTGIEFRSVLVRKGIWERGSFCPPDIRRANLYARKVLGGRLVGDRSIWNLDPAQRFVAPPDFHARLVAATEGRVQWGVPADFSAIAPQTFAQGRAPVITTAPLDITLAALGMHTDARFVRAGISVERFRVPDCDVHQTVYFPAPSTSVYRASITGDLLIVERAEGAGFDPREMFEVLAAFGLRIEDVTALDHAEQRYGKIVNIPDGERKRLLFKLTQEHKIYSIGRFATWRNILLDDVVQDAQRVKAMIAQDLYDVRMAAT